MSRWSPAVIADDPEPRVGFGEAFGNAFANEILTYGERQRQGRLRDLEEERLRLGNAALERDLATRGNADVIAAVGAGFRPEGTARDAAAPPLPPRLEADLPAFQAGARAGGVMLRPGQGGVGVSSSFGNEAESSLSGARAPAALSPSNYFADAVEGRDEDLRARPAVVANGQRMVWAPEAVAAEPRYSRQSGLTFGERLALQDDGQAGAMERLQYTTRQKVEALQAEHALRRELARLQAKGRESSSEYQEATLRLRELSVTLQAMGLVAGYADDMSPSNAIDRKIQGSTAEGRQRLHSGDSARSAIVDQVGTLLKGLQGGAERGAIVPNPEGTSDTNRQRRTVAPVDTTGATGDPYSVDAIEARRRRLRP